MTDIVIDNFFARSDLTFSPSSTLTKIFNNFYNFKDYINIFSGFCILYTNIVCRYFIIGERISSFEIFYIILFIIIQRVL